MKFEQRNKKETEKRDDVHGKIVVEIFIYLIQKEIYVIIYYVIHA